LRDVRREFGKPDSLLTEQIADHSERRDAHHDAAADPVYSSLRQNPKTRFALGL
jgi:hypothetical protein